MCCILACFDSRPTLATITNIMRANSDGVGVAWLDRAAGVTRWQKGMQTPAAVFALTETLPLPLVVHARWATAGGATPALTHPFPVGLKPSLALAGETNGPTARVLFHNGHIAGWEDIARNIGFQLPRNARGWSDTRIMAALVARKGAGVLPLMTGQKFALLSIAGGLEIFGSYTDVGGGVFASSYAGPPMWEPSETVPISSATREPFGWSFDRDDGGQAGRMREAMEQANREEREWFGFQFDNRLERIDAARERLRAMVPQENLAKLDRAVRAMRLGKRGGGK